MESESKQIAGYSYGDSTISRASMTLEEFSKLKLGAQFGENQERHLRLAWEVLRDQTTEIVNLWRAEIIARIPHLARHSKAQGARHFLNILLGVTDASNSGSKIPALERTTRTGSTTRKK